MDIYINQKIRVVNPTREMLNYCNINLRYPNPEYQKKVAMGKWVGTTPREIVLFERRGEELLLPFGLIKELYGLFKDTANFYPEFNAPQPREFKSRINLYDYQENAVQSILRAKNGVLVAPCGSGKSNMGIEIIARLGLKALWITHTLDLLQQSKQRAESVLGLSPEDYGVIAEGKVNIGNAITFATVQTLSCVNLKEIQNEWNVIVVDEVHRAVGSPAQARMFYKVLSSLNARNKIGLTATPYRADHMEKTMFALLGGVAYEVPKSAVKDKTCPVKVRVVQTNYSPEPDNVTLGDGTLVYTSLINDITNNLERNLLIADLINGLDGGVLVLTDRISHEETLKKLIHKRSVIVKGSGNKADKEARENAFIDLKNGNIDVILTSYKLAKEGLDVPSLKYVVLASPQKDKATIIQSCGRVARKSEGKNYGTVIDFSDNFGMLQSYLKKRKTIYKAQGYEVL